MSTGMIPELMPTWTVSSGWHVVSPRILTDVDVNTGLEMLRELHDGDMTGMTYIQLNIRSAALRGEILPAPNHEKRSSKKCHTCLTTEYMARPVIPPCCPSGDDHH